MHRYTAFFYVIALITMLNGIRMNDTTSLPYLASLAYLGVGVLIDVLTHYGEVKKWL